MSTTDSGVKRWVSPSMGFLNSTPSSERVASSLRENTWYPPESVSIGLVHCMKLCRPSAPSITFRPGRRKRWYVLPRIICAPMSDVSTRGETAFTLPLVPTGMNTGVSTVPCAVRSRPARASEEASVWSSVNVTGRRRRGRSATVARSDC